MQVIATAGHVDHGKSTLLRALTGMEPDRWAEEKRRGLTIDLGFAWLTLPSGERIAFVDVPGHERFVPNMLAGVGPVPAVLFVVAADEGWMPQSAEHLAVLDALGIRSGLLVVTRSDLADPGPALAAAGAELAAASLGPVPAVAVSAVTGEGLPRCWPRWPRWPAPARARPGGPGPALGGPGVHHDGQRHGGDRHAARRHRAPRRRAGAVPRHAPGAGPRDPDAGRERPRPPGWPGSRSTCAACKAAGRRGMALVHAGRWTLTTAVDVRLSPPRAPLPGRHRRPGSHRRAPWPRATRRRLQARDSRAHGRCRRNGMGSAAEVRWGRGDGEPACGGRARRWPCTSARRAPRPGSLLGAGIARLTLRDPLPLHVGDRLLLRDPGSAGPRASPGARAPSCSTSRRRRSPAAARRRGRRDAGRLAGPPRPPSTSARHGLLRSRALLAMGISELPQPVAGEWLSARAWPHAGRAAGRGGGCARRGRAAGARPAAEAARAALDLPDRRLVEAWSARR